MLYVVSCVRCTCWRGVVRIVSLNKLKPNIKRYDIETQLRQTTNEVCGTPFPMTSVAYLGGGAIYPLLSDCEFLDNFNIDFVSVVSRLNRNVCVPRLLVTVRIFFRLKTPSKCTQLIILETKMILFWGRAHSLHQPTPPPRRLLKSQIRHWMTSSDLHGHLSYFMLETSVDLLDFFHL